MVESDAIRRLPAAHAAVVRAPGVGRLCCAAVLGFSTLWIGACGSASREVLDLPSQTLIDPVNDDDRSRIASAGEADALETEGSFEQSANRASGNAIDEGMPVTQWSTPSSEPVEVERTDRPRGALTTVIDDGAPTSRPQSLLEAAAAQKKRREGDSERAQFVVTDSNLSSFKNVPLTTATPSEKAPEAAEDTVSSDVADESYWRDRIGGLRQEWHDQVELKAELRTDILRHREAFYAADDPYYRDAEIKPLWDRALEEFDDVTRRIENVREDLRNALMDGRRKGVFPGWLREGVELEPDDSMKDLDDFGLIAEPTSGAVPSEPTTYEGPDGP